MRLPICLLSIRLKNLFGLPVRRPMAAFISFAFLAKE
jgi:hypothetical protein